MSKLIWGIVGLFLALSITMAWINNFYVTNRVAYTLNCFVFKKSNKNISELQFEKCIRELEKNKNFILNSNTISYLFQVVIILILTIGGYYLGIIQNIAAKMKKDQDEYRKKFTEMMKDQNEFRETFDKHNRLMKTFTHTSSIYFNKDKPNCSSNLEKTHHLKDNLDHIQQIISTSNITISEVEKTNYKDTIGYIKQRVERLIKEETKNTSNSNESSYFSPLLKQINEVEELIDTVKLKDQEK